MEQRSTRKTFFISCAFASLFCSCINFSDLQMPENIKVKTNGNYSFLMGTQKNMLSDYINVETLLKSLKGDDESDKKISAYDYNPDEKDGTQQFLIKYDLPTIPLNMEETMKDIQLDKIMMEGMSKEFKITKPELSFSQSLDLNFNNLIADKFSANIPSFPVVQMGTETDISVGENPVLQGVTFHASPTFTSLTMSSGSLEITFEAKNSLPADFELELAAELYNGDQLVSSSGSMASLTDQSVSAKGGAKVGGVISIPLSGKTFSSDFSVRFKGRTNGGTLGVYTYYTMTARLKDPVVSKITGLTMDDPSFSKPISKNIELGDVGKYLVYGTIATGAVGIELELPSVWENVTVDSSFSMEGALEISPIPDRAESTKALDKYVDLAGKKITLMKSRTEANKLSVNGNVSFKLEDATLVFESENTTMELVCTGNIEKLTDVYANASEFSFDDSKSQALPATMKQYVKEMKLTQISVAANFTSTLDISKFNLNAMATSDALHLYSADNTQLEGSTVVGGDKPLTMLTKQNWSVTVAVQDDTIFDFVFKVSVPGSYESTTGINCLHLATFTLDTDYEIKVDQLELDLDWEYIILKTDAIAPTTPEEIDTGINLEKMISDFFNTSSENTQNEAERKKEIKNIVDRINLAEVKGYLYVTRPDISDDVADDPLEGLGNFSGKVYAKYTKDGNSHQEYLIGSETETADLRLLYDAQDANTLNYESLADENYLIVKNLFDNESKYSAELNGDTLCSMVNAKPSELKFGYSFSISDGSDEIRLTPEVLENLKGTKAITMSVVLCLPLKLNIGTYNDTGIKEGIAIDDLMTLLGNPLTEDLLNRDESDVDPITDDTEIEKVSKLLKYVKLHYTFQNNTGLKMSANLTATSSKGETYLNKNLYLDGERHDVELPNSEIMAINNSWPFIPKISLAISPTDDEAPINIMRKAFFSLSDCMLEFETDGEYTVKGDD